GGLVVHLSAVRRTRKQQEVETPEKVLHPLAFGHAAALARELDPRWNYRSAELMTLYAKAKAHEAGEKVEF
ncbi:hypothetical protein, partial [Aeromonas caviae]|uniref:hypothetical protein n=1 Tax=Aeromonas caviae TaxID=648 RepID=UPI001CC6E8A3